MNLDSARAVADAVLWEGYLLYPYRASSAKNQLRWQFGVLGPPLVAGGDTGIAEDPTMHIECLFRPGEGARLSARLRFLHLVRRQVHLVTADGIRRVEEHTVNGRTLLSFDEAVPCELTLGPFDVKELQGVAQLHLAAPAGEEVEDIRDAGGTLEALVERHRKPLIGSMALHIEHADVPEWLKLTIDLSNESPESVADRAAATALSFIGAHLILDIEQGMFASILEPPDGLEDQAAQCRQHRCWPVLAGSAAGDGLSDILLASPIILYDHPAVAPESAGALFDSTEIDEILTLRVMTLTDEEKAAARATDPAAAAIIDRCDAMSAEDLARLHGVLRDPRADLEVSTTGLPGSFGSPGKRWTAGDFDLSKVPVLGESAPADNPTGDRPAADLPWWDPGVDASVSPTTDTVRIDNTEIGAGAIVRLRPQRRADAQDLFYAGQTARVVSVYSDVDGNSHVAVVLTDDPAAEMHEWYGRYLYFAPDELQLTAKETPS